VKHALDVLGVFHVLHVLYLFGSTVAKTRNLCLNFDGQGLGAAAEDVVRQDAVHHQTFESTLGGFGLGLASDLRHVGEHVDDEVVLTVLHLHLAHGLLLDHAFNVANCAADLNEADFRHLVFPTDFVEHGLLGDRPDPLFDLVGAVGNHLDRLAQLVPPAFLVDGLLEHTARGHVVLRGEREVVHAFVVAQVEVGLAPVVHHLHLPVLVRRQRARVHIELRVDFDQRHFLSLHFQ